jgi:hypothetical protein
VTNDETTALAELDRLGARAGAALRTAVPADLAVPAEPGVNGHAHADSPDSRPRSRGGDPGNGGENEEASAPAGAPPADGPAVLPVAGRRRPRRGPWLAAAAVLVLAAGVVAAVLRPDGGPDEAGTAMSRSEVQYLVPDPLPEGWADRAPLVSNGLDIDGVDAVYGDGRLEDPWTGPMLEVSVLTGPDTGPPSADGEPITIGGEQGRLRQDTVGDGTWLATSGHLAVTSSDRALVEAAAPHVTDEPAIAAAGLPDGFEELARGDFNANIGGVEFLDEGLVVDYGIEGTSVSSDGPSVTVTQRLGRPEAVDLLRGVSDASRPDTVRGHHAVVDASGGSVHVQWWEPSGLLVTLGATGVDEGELLRFAESLRPASGEELDRLLGAYAVEDGDLVTPPAPDPELDPGEGENGAGGITREQMEVLREACVSGWMDSCDHMWQVTAVGSELEAVAQSCGGRDPEGDENGTCAARYPSTGSPPDTSGFPPTDLDTPQDPAQAEALRADCAAGDMAACDGLWAITNVGSDLEAFAETCGGRVPEGGHQGTCVAELGSASAGD